MSVGESLNLNTKTEFLFLLSFIFQMDIDEEMSEALYSQLLELEKEIRSKLREENAGKKTSAQCDRKATHL